MPPASRGWLQLFGRSNFHPASQTSRRYAASASLPALPKAAPIKIILRKYQEECIQAVLTHLRSGHKRLGVSLATGSGKTVIFTQLIDRIVPQTKTAHQTLILAHRQELVEQAAHHCTNAYPTKSVEIEMGSLHSSGMADITVASVQSIISGDRINKFVPDRFKLVLVDEAHHIVAPGYLKTLAHFGLAKTDPTSPALVGVSATLSRFDGLKLGAAIDQIVYHKDYVDMIGEKWLSDVCFTTVQSKADISAVRRGANGDFQPSELSEAVNTDAINEITFRSWFAKAKERKSTLVFCVDLTHVAGLTNKFREYGIDAQFVTGNTPKAERSARLDSFRRREFPVLVNCGVFTEGTDIPNIDCVLLARPTKSRNLLVQMIGRGMRLYPGKKNCHIIDMVASLETGIVTTPTLFGLDPSEILEESTVEDMEKLKQQQEELELGKVYAEASSKQFNPPSSAKVPQNLTFTDYDSVFDLIQDTSGERHIRAISQHAWVCVAEERFILANTTGSYLKIQKAEVLSEGFVVSETVSLPRTDGEYRTRSPYMRPREIAKSRAFSDAVHAADTFAKKKYPYIVISKTVPWRSLPPTEGQLMFLNKLRPQVDQLTADSLTKGQATDMITKVKHGARGRFSSLEAERRKMEKVKMKLGQHQAMKAREKVSIGPLVD